ncbi:MAG TPA: hypothetical protein DIW31_10685 [Bacteroidales bacterium]|nr:hypothetical protein [Bacteroidales bacterium]
MKTNRKTIVLALSLQLLLFIACEKVEEQQTNSNKVVVEGYLQPNHKATIKVTKELAYESNDSVLQPIDGLEIMLTNNDFSELMVDKGSGVYESNSLTIFENERYSIKFYYNKKLVKAETIVPSKPDNFTASATSFAIPSFSPFSGEPPSFPDPIKLNWSNPDNKYCLVVVKNIESNPTAIFDTTRFELKKIFRNKPMQSDNYELNMRSFNYYGTHQIIVFNINAEYVSLYDDNGTSSLNIQTPSTNVSGGLGIFTGINSDTVYVEVHQ